MSVVKPLHGKAYGHLPHLPGSRLGPGDHHCEPGQARIATEQARDGHDVIWVTEKLDGSNCAVWRDGDRIVPLIRAGYRAEQSPYLQHHYFAVWAYQHYGQFLELLQDGEWCVGEWLAQVHGTRYALWHEPYVIFDLIQGRRPKGGFVRVPWDIAQRRIAQAGFPTPHLISVGPPRSIAWVQQYFADHGSGHGAIDPPEGAVWRVERDGQCDFLVKWVRPDKVDGQYLPERRGGEALWHWRPASGAGVANGGESPG